MTVDEALTKLRECDHYLEELHVVKAEIERLGAVNDRLRADRREILDVKSTKGLTSSEWLEWLARTGKAETEAKRLRAENAKLKQKDSEAAGTLRANIAEIQLVEAMRELDWFRRRDQQIKAQADTRHLGAQLLAGYLAEYERANPKPGAGT